MKSANVTQASQASELSQILVGAWHFVISNFRTDNIFWADAIRVLFQISPLNKNCSQPILNRLNSFLSKQQKEQNDYNQITTILMSLRDSQNSFVSKELAICSNQNLLNRLATYPANGFQDEVYRFYYNSAELEGIKYLVLHPNSYYNQCLASYLNWRASNQIHLAQPAKQHQSNHRNAQSKKKSKPGFGLSQKIVILAFLLTILAIGIAVVMLVAVI